VTVAVDRILTVGSVMQTLDQDYWFEAGACLAPGLVCKAGVFEEAPTLSFDLGDTGTVDVTFLRVVKPGDVITVGSGGTGTLTARFLLHDVPEPAAVLHLGSFVALARVRPRSSPPDQ